MTSVAALFIIVASANPSLRTASLWAAAVVVVSRFVMTAIVWSRNAYPGDDTPDNAVLDQHPGMCVLGHFVDMVLFTSFGVYLERGSGFIAGIVILVIANLLILATVLRLAAHTPRLHLERMARGATSIAAIVGFLVDQPFMILAAFVPAGIIATVETLEAVAKLRSLERERDQWYADPPIPRQALSDQDNKSYAAPLLIVDA